MTTETTVANVANKIAVGGGSVAFWGGWTANEWAAYGGLLVAVLGLIVQIAFKIRADMRDASADRREAEEHAARMRLYAQGIDPRE